jgi:hypothetical protein
VVDYVKIRDVRTTGNAFNPDSPAYQALLRPLLELVKALYEERGFGQDITVEVTFKITPGFRTGKLERS